MIRKASSFSCFARWGTAGATALALMTQSGWSRADEVPATGKGIAGGALLGGEVVMLAEAAFGVKSGWIYVISGVVGAGGGGYAGSVIESNADSKVSLYMLAGGMALVIPTIVAVLQATSYSPPDEYTEDKPAGGAPAGEPPRATPGTVPSASRGEPRPVALHYHWQQPAQVKVAPGLLGIDDGALRVAVPSVEVRPMYGTDELQKYGLAQKHEFRVPVFSTTF